MLVLVAFDVIEQDAAGQTEDPDQLQEREAAAGLLGTRLRVMVLVLGGVGGGDRGAIDDLGVETEPIPWGVGEELLDARRDGMAEGVSLSRGRRRRAWQSALVPGSTWPRRWSRKKARVWRTTLRQGQPGWRT